MVVRGNFKQYDVCSLSGDIALEVKLDTKSMTTGNFAIEYSYRGEPSGIAATTADYFVLVVPKQKRELLRWIHGPFGTFCNLRT